MNLMKYSQITLFSRWLITLKSAEQLDIAILLSGCCFYLLSATCLLADAIMRRRVAQECLVYIAISIWTSSASCCAAKTAAYYTKSTLATAYWSRCGCNISTWPIEATRWKFFQKRVLSSVHLAGDQTWTSNPWRSSVCLHSSLTRKQAMCSEREYI